MGMFQPVLASTHWALISRAVPDHCVYLCVPVAQMSFI